MGTKTKSIDDILGVDADAENESNAVESNEVNKDNDNHEVEPKEKAVPEKTKEKSTSSTKKVAEKKSTSDLSRKQKQSDKSANSENVSDTSNNSESSKRGLDHEKIEDKSTSAMKDDLSSDVENPSLLPSVDNNNDSEEELPLRKYEVDVKEIYPIRIFPTAHIPVYRGPSLSLRIKDFGGAMYVLDEPDANGFSPVSFVRSEYGTVKGYIRLTKEVIQKCRR